jgi:hypothetical protein
MLSVLLMTILAMSEVPSRSPTPNYSQAPDEPDHDRQQLIEEASKHVQYDCTKVSTADLQEIVNAIRTDQTPAVEAPWGHIEVSAHLLIPKYTDHFLCDQTISHSPVAIAIAGGNHLDRMQIDGE